jgi:hypothetical protein
MGCSSEKLGDRRVRVARAPGLISVRETVLAGPGDMMIDGVVPLGVWPRRSFEAVQSVPWHGKWRQEPYGASATGMATVHRLREGRRVHPHQRHQPGRGA